MFIFVSVNVGYSKDLGATWVEVTGEYIHVDSAYCSCSLSTGYYRHHDISFKNRCPNCGGKLHYEEMSYWVEGIWVCGKCDMDFCLVHGKSHDHRNYYLSRYKIPDKIPEPERSEIKYIHIMGMKFQKIFIDEYKKQGELKIW